MRLLLDTHTFLWWCTDDPRLSLTALDVLGAADTEVYLSSASAWEIAIKTRLKRLELPRPPTEFIPEMISRHSLAVLPVSLTHSLHDFELPSLHSDPFDRLLVAQTVTEDMKLVTNDRAIVQYDVPTLW